MAERIIAVKLTPKASRNEVRGWAKDAAGQPYLKISVTAVPEKGKANEAMIKLLSEHFGIHKNAFSIIRGISESRKTIKIQ